MDQPKVKPSQRLIFKKTESHGQISVSPKGSGNTIQRVTAEKFLGRADKILHIMILLEGVPDPVDGIFLPPYLGIAAKNLQDAKSPQDS